jgi:hypothetical protein
VSVLKPDDVNPARRHPEAIAATVADALDDALGDWEARRQTLALPDDEPILLVALSRMEVLSIRGILGRAPARLAHERVALEASDRWLREFG